MAFAHLENVELVLGCGDFMFGLGDVVVEVESSLCKLIKFVAGIVDFGLGVVDLLSDGTEMLVGWSGTLFTLL